VHWYRPEDNFSLSPDGTHVAYTDVPMDLASP
jgi:hypothetical protein